MIQGTTFFKHMLVIPAQAGIHHLTVRSQTEFRYKSKAQVLVSRLRGNDEVSGRGALRVSASPRELFFAPFVGSVSA